jgi:hypothetical protein
MFANSHQQLEFEGLQQIQINYSTPKMRKDSQTCNALTTQPNPIQSTRMPRSFLYRFGDPGSQNKLTDWPTNWKSKYVPSVVALWVLVATRNFDAQQKTRDAAGNLITSNDNQLTPSLWILQPVSEQHALGKMVLTMCALPSEWLHGFNFGKHHHDRLHERRDLELENKIIKYWKIAHDSVCLMMIFWAHILVPKH